MAESAVLEIEDLVIDFHTPRGRLRAVDGVSLTLERGRTLGLVGESGSGKSVTSLAIPRLLAPNAEIVSGRILFEGQDLLRASERQLRSLRGAGISMIFQEPMTSLNPLMRVGDQVAEVVRLHESLSRADARRRASEMLGMVGIADPEQRARAWPHELSGGMRQRVMIAMAVVCRPKLLIADEPTTALDVTIERQILALLGEMRERFGMSVLLITHDLGVVAQEAEDVAILYSGRLVERASASTVFASPAHPYTRLLLDSLPDLRGRSGRLAAIPGAIPEPDARPGGCRFRDRCWKAAAACAENEPVLAGQVGGSAVACVFPLAAGERP